MQNKRINQFNKLSEKVRWLLGFDSPRAESRLTFFDYLENNKIKL